MAYNRKNFLERVLAVQKIVLAEQEHGATLSWIYRNRIKARFHISKSTFDNYLSIAAKAELNRLEECNQIQK